MSCSKYFSAQDIRGLVLCGVGILLVWLVEPQIARAQLEEGRFPYRDTMVISAYYSPLPDQEKYVTGSYDGDIRLNGSGVNGADGTPVYPGMIAAPASFPFGFKMTIPGIGTVAVHDRGGAIKGSRLDVWMGYGDEGLKRALNWGKRTVEVEMLGVTAQVKESVYLAGYYEAEKLVRRVARITNLFPEDIWYQSEGEDVRKLQGALKEIGYFDGEVSGFYGDDTLEAVYVFQVDNGIVSDWNDFGAGHCGVQTRMTLERKISGTREKSGGSTAPSPNPKEVFFSREIKRGDKGDEVVLLQKELKKLGFLRISPTGEFGEVTAHAVFKFQQKKGLVTSKNDMGAGVVGPKTRMAMNAVFADREQKDRMVAAKAAESDSGKIAGLFAADIDPGVSSSDVTALQDTLKKLGYFSGNTTSFFGPQTEAALIAFQVDKGIIPLNTSKGAGRLGPQTRALLNKILKEV